MQSVIGSLPREIRRPKNQKPPFLTGPGSRPTQPAVPEVPLSINTGYAVLWTLGQGPNPVGLLRKGLQAIAKRRTLFG